MSEYRAFTFSDIKHGSGSDVDDLRISGIYAIQNDVSGHRYVGSSARMLVRARTHLKELVRGDHHCSHLQNAVNKYGIDAFSFLILEIVRETEELQSVEQKWIDDCGYYNTAKSSRGPVGVKLNLSSEERKRRSDRAKAMNAGRTADEVRRVTTLASAARLEMGVSPETREKLSKAMVGRVFSATHKENIKGALKRDPRHKQRQVSAAQRAIVVRSGWSDERRKEWREKISQSRKGVPLSAEHRAKISIGLRTHFDT